MKPALIIGSTVADVTIRLPRLPHTGQDINISSQSMTLGGCAFNVSEMLRRFDLPYHLFSPVGSGIYGDFVRSRLQEKEIPLLIPCPEEENGCCYCFVESTGERTFAALHGAEYRFKPQWFDLLDPKELGPVYVCGLELEEDTGEVILDYLEANPPKALYFAPGPRIGEIGQEKLERMWNLSPVLHLNGQEAKVCAEMMARVDGDRTDAPVREYTVQAAQIICRRTGNHVIVTLGADGALICYRSGCWRHIPSRPARQVDANGAGDSHAGTVIACGMRGMSLVDSVRTANLVAAAAVEHPGAGLPDEVFDQLKLNFK